MAYLIARADGNLTAAATWGTVDATSLLDSEANNTALTTSYVESATSTPGAITIDGIAVKVAVRAASPTGTMSVRLAQAGATVAGTEVVINVSDLTVCVTADQRNGWILFKFAAPVLLVAATLYTVSAKTSTGSQVNLFRNATAGNWSRMLRTTTTAAPAAGDSWFILGEWTAAATKTNRVVTMNQTATTDYGGASTTIASVGISVGGTLTWGTTAATNYILRLSGLLIISAGGTMTMGTTALPVPRDSSAELQFDSAADGDFGLIVWGTLSTQGLSRTVDLNVVQCLLNTDEAIGQTTLGVSAATGWLSGDEVAIASTTTTATEAETGTLNGAAGASSIVVNVALTAAHSGTSPNQAEVILITRNVRIVAVTTTAMWYGQIQTASTVDCDWTLFRYGGANTSFKTAMLSMQGTGPTAFAIDFCAFANSEQNGIDATAGCGTGLTFAISDCTFYACGVVANAGAIEINGAAGTWNITRCTSIGDLATITTSTFVRVASDVIEGWRIDSCRVSSSIGSAVQIFPSTGSAYGVPKLITDCVFHCLSQASAAGYVGLSGTSGHLAGVRILNTQFRRSSTTSAAIVASSCISDLYVENCTFVACLGGAFTTTGALPGLRFVGCVFAGDSVFAQTSAVAIVTAGSNYGPWRFENCTFGVGTAHSVADFVGTSVTNVTLDWTLINCLLSSATEFSAAITTAGNTLSRSVIRRHRKDGTTNVHESLFPNFGTIAYEATTFRTAAPAEKLTPTVGANSYFKLRSSAKRVPVLLGQAATVSCYVRKDATYAGNQPRLVIAGNPAIGVDTDLVLDTMTGTHSVWEQLTGTMTPVAEEDGVVEVFVEVDGVAGNVYVDDWSASSA